MLRNVSKLAIRASKAPLSTSLHLKAVFEIETMEEFNKTVTNVADKTIIVDFHAEWCGPCKMMAPALKQVLEADSNVDLVKIDVDEADNDLLMKFQVSAMPTLLFFKNGEEKAKKVGMLNKEQLEAVISTI